MHGFSEFEILSVPLKGCNLIEASAGTGKTHTISSLFLRLILEEGIEVRNILVVTFTEAATKELKDRIRKNLIEAGRAAGCSEACSDDTLRRILQKAIQAGGLEHVRAVLRKAVAGFDAAAIFTIHGFCNRMLIDNSFETTLLFDSELIADQSAIIQEVADDFWRTTFSAASPVLSAIAKKHDLTPPGLAARARETVNRPLLKVIPADGDIPAGDMPALFKAVQTEWGVSGREVTEILSADRGLKRDAQTYRPDRLAAYITTLTQALSGVPTADTLHSIAMFAAGTLRQSLKKGCQPPAHRFFDLCDDFCRAEHRFALRVKLDFIAFIREELYRRKRRRNVQSFDDLLLNVRNALASSAGPDLARAIRNQYRSALIDEFQDTDPVQYDIFNTLFNVNNHSFFLIGDPKQSIYGFRGADVFSYLQAVARTPARCRYTLKTNWRSETNFVKAINHLFTIPANPFVLGDAIAYHLVQPGEQSVGNRDRLTIAGDDAASLIIVFLATPDPAGRKGLTKADAREQAAGAVVAEISRILTLSTQGRAMIGDRPVRPSDFAVLVTRNADGLLFAERLARLNIPAVLAKTGNVFHSEEAEQVEQLLYAVAAPHSTARIHAALATPLAGCSGRDICGFIEDETALAAYELHLENFRTYNEIWHTMGFMRMFRTFLGDYETRQKLLALPDGERRLTNVLHIAELLHAAACEGRRGMNSLLGWLSQQRTTDDEAEEKELRLERDDEAVQILTVFKSKGLEFPIVFCPFMWQQGAAGDGPDLAFHDEGVMCLDIGSPDRDTINKARAEQERLSELMRLLYVAVTRARNRCYLAYGKIGSRFAATSLDYLFSGGVDQDEQSIQALSARQAGLSAEKLQDAITKHLLGTDAIRLKAPAAQNTVQKYFPAREQEPQVRGPRVLTDRRAIKTDWGIASYSMLIEGESPGTLRRDETAEQEDTTGQNAPEPAGFFAFPKGPAAGTCIHSIFEKLDFSLHDDLQIKALIQDVLKNFGLDVQNADPQQHSPRVTAVYEMIQHVLHAPLVPQRTGFNLSLINPEHRLAETGFFYPLKKITPQILRDIFSRHAGTSGVLAGDVPEKIGELSFRPVRGYMQGFIDVIFRHEGRFYLLDWKTNHLGNAYSDYTPEKIKTNMAASFYTLQYHIYTVALHKYLQGRLAGYQYDTHFGGVFYCYVRGITPALPGNGIFYDRPATGLVEELCTLCA